PLPMESEVFLSRRGEWPDPVRRVIHLPHRVHRAWPLLETVDATRQTTHRPIPVAKTLRWRGYAMHTLIGHSFVIQQGLVQAKQRAKQVVPVRVLAVLARHGPPSLPTCLQTSH